MKEKIMVFIKGMVEDINERYDCSAFYEVISIHITVWFLICFFKQYSFEIYFCILGLAFFMGISIARISSIWKYIINLSYIIDSAIEENEENEEIKNTMIEYIWGVIVILVQGVIVGVSVLFEFKILIL